VADGEVNVMLSESMIQLLTAFVDGEMNPRQREEVMRLLNKSAEAREMLRQLQENAHKVKMLPHRKVEPSLVDEIVEAIAERKAQPKPVLVARRRWMPYLAASLAASLLMGTIGVVYWRVLYDGDKSNKIDEPVIVQNDKKPEPKVIPDPLPTPKKQNPLLAMMSNMTEAIVRDTGAPVPPEKHFAASFRDLDKAGKATSQFVHELNRGKSVQLDITVKNNADAMKRLQAVLKHHEIKLVTDPSAKKKLDDKNQAKVEYLVYAENLTSGELAKLVNELSESYVVPAGLNNQKSVQSPYQKMTVLPLAADEKQTLAKLLGVDPSALERKDAKTATKTERSIVLLPTTPGAQPSAEVKQFVNSRRDAQPGALQVLIKIRQE